MCQKPCQDGWLDTMISKCVSEWPRALLMAVHLGVLWAPAHCPSSVLVAAEVFCKRKAHSWKRSLPRRGRRQAAVQALLTRRRFLGGVSSLFQGRLPQGIHEQHLRFDRHQLDCQLVEGATQAGLRN